MRSPLENRMLVLLLLICSSNLCFGEEILRDPTRPYKKSEYIAAETPRYVVNAIIVSADRKVAIVNGRRVGVGASVGGALIVAIEKDQLILEKNGERITARLNDGAPGQ